MTDAIIEIGNVTKSFGGVVANRGVSLTVPRGGITGLIGPNGSGKTTLFNSIFRYHPIPATGSITSEVSDSPAADSLAAPGKRSTARARA